MNAKTDFKKMIHSLIDIKRGMLKRSSELERSIDEFRNILNPEQVGKFLIWLETVSSTTNFVEEKQG